VAEATPFDCTGLTSEVVLEAEGQRAASCFRRRLASCSCVGVYGRTAHDIELAGIRNRVNRFVHNAALGSVALSHFGVLLEIQCNITISSQRELWQWMVQPVRGGKPELQLLPLIDLEVLEHSQVTVEVRG
jgi:hypothetical protein